MNVFDFDGTLYYGDSTLDFFIFAAGKNKKCLTCLPAQVGAWVLFKAKRISRDQFKERFYAFLAKIDDVDAMVDDFWASHMQNMIGDVVSKARPGDIVISASPDWLLQKPCQKLGLRLIASGVDKKSGHLLGPNCRDEEKVRRWEASEWHGPIDEFYTDSTSDLPMARLAKKSYLVTKKGIEKLNV